MGRRIILMLEIREVLYQWVHGVSQRKIYHSLGVSRNTVRGIITQAKKLGLSVGESDDTKIETTSEAIKNIKISHRILLTPVDIKLKPYHEQIESWLLMPSMTVKQIWRLLSEETPPICIGINSLHRYMHRHFKKPTNATMVIPTIPGKQAQVDFGYVGLMKEPNRKKSRKAYAFVMTLSHSRYRFIFFVFRQDTKTWIDCHRRAFNFFGGVPETILLDNLKAGVIKPDIYDPVINKTYAEFERHYGFIADPAKVRMPEHKGKVERSVTIVKQQIIAGRNFSDINHANEYALSWASSDIANQVTRTTGETPCERFIRDEKEKLKPLPLVYFECPIWSEVKVGRDQHACFKGAFYSIPLKYVEKKISIRATATIVQFYDGINFIKSHKIASRKGEWVTDFNDLNASAKHFLNNTVESCFFRASHFGDATLTLIKDILDRSSTTRLRKADAILRLGDVYGHSRLEAACLRALSFNTKDYKTIVNILEKKLDKQDSFTRNNLSETELTEGAFLREASEFTIH